jgi:D-xylose transport system substrate-binding protein
LKKLMRWSAPALVIALVAGLAISTASAQTRAKQTRKAGIQACALLPDTKTSTRWTLFDAPYLTKAFKAGGVSAKVFNAHGSPLTQRSQAEQCLAQGAKVILLCQLDPGSGTAITNLAVGQGAKVIDYDRLIVGSKVSYYVSFDNVKVGKLQGTGLVKALTAKGKMSSHPVIAQLNGDTKDNNAHLFKQGYDSILNPLFKSGKLKKASSGDQWTDWDPVKGQTIYEQMLAKNSNHIDGVLAANDGLAGAVIAAEKNRGLKPVPVTGQDATPTGVQFILAGWQSGTVYKSVRAEAQASAKVAINLIKGQSVKTNGKVSGTPSVLLTPVWITKANYKLLFSEGFLKRSQVCIGQYKKFCK